MAHSVLYRLIFSGPADCADLVNSFQSAEKNIALEIAFDFGPIFPKRTGIELISGAKQIVHRRLHRLPLPTPWLPDGLLGVEEGRLPEGARQS
jgi:hypothetical protein